MAIETDDLMQVEVAHSRVQVARYGRRLHMSSRTLEDFGHLRIETILATKITTQHDHTSNSKEFVKLFYCPESFISMAKLRNMRYGRLQVAV